MSEPYLAWVRDIDYRGNSPRHEVLEPVKRCEYHREAMCRCQDCDGFDCSDFAGIGADTEDSTP